MAIIPRTKICGVTRERDAIAVAHSGADAVGLNLVPSSPRCLTAAQLQRVSRAVAGQVFRVAVVANSDPTFIESLVATECLDCLQLHGDEDPKTTPDYGLPYIRAIRLRDTSADAMNAAVQPWLDRAFPPAAILLDAWSATQLGGTGQTADWELAARLVEHISPLPLILAGGLTPANVGSAIEQVRPAGVDTASGVESSPGIKDPDRVRAFVTEATAAFKQLND